MMLGTKIRLKPFSTKITLILIAVLVVVSSIVVPPSGPPKAEAIAGLLSCYDPDYDPLAGVPAFVCSGQNGADLYYDGTTGQVNILGLNNRAVEDGRDVSFYNGAPNGEEGGLTYCSTKNSLCDEIVTISDPCTPGIGRWHMTNGAGADLVVEDITIAYGEINKVAEQLCLEQAELLAFDVTVVLRLDEPVDYTINFGSLYLEVRDLDNNVLATGRGPNLGIAAGGTSASEEVFVSDPALVNGQRYKICFLEDNGGEQCHEVPKTENIQQYTLRLETIEEAATIGGSARAVIEQRDSTCHAGLFNLIFRFIVCPLIDGLFSAIDTFYTELIIPLLVIDPLSDSGQPGSPEEALFEIWNDFRIVANVLFIIVLLLAIFGLSFAGFELFSAYELRKIVPRLVLGIIGVQLSWYMVGFALDIFNVLGAGVRGLLLAPVEGLQISGNLDFHGIWKELQLNLGLVGGIGLTYVAVKGGVLAGIGMILTPIVLGLFLVIVTLIARKIAIMILILASPIAFVAWILPNTQGMFMKWWDYFWKLMMMYPIIIALIASGELFSKVITGSNTAADGSQQSIFTSIFGMIALFAPYFLIPRTFQFAGSAVAQLAGGLGERTKGISDRFWGDYRDPNSRRSQRRDKIRENRRQLREGVGRWGFSPGSEKFRGALGKWGSKPGSGRVRSAMGNWGSRPGSGRVRKTIAKAAIRADRNPALDAVQRQQDAAKEYAQVAHTGHIEGLMSHLGPHRVDTGQAMSAYGQNLAYHNMAPGNRNIAMIEEALFDVMNKSNSGTQSMEIADRWLNGDPMLTGAGIKDRGQRQAILSRVAERDKSLFLDFGSGYRDFSEDGGFRMSSDPAKGARFLSEINSRRGDFRQLSMFRASVWDGSSEVFDQVHDIYQRANDDAVQQGGHWTEHLANEDEHELMRQAAMIRSSLSPYSGDQGAPVSVESWKGFYNKIHGREKVPRRPDLGPQPNRFDFLKQAVDDGKIKLA